MVRDQRARFVAFAGVLMMACSSAPSAPSPAATIRIGPSGVDPRELRIERFNYDADYVASQVAESGLPAEYGEKLLVAA